MKQIRKKEGNGPDANDTYHCPDSGIEGVASKDSFVEEQHRELREAVRQRGAQLLCVVDFQKNHVTTSPDSIAFVIQYHMSGNISISDSNVDAYCGDDGEYLCVKVTRRLWPRSRQAGTQR